MLLVGIIACVFLTSCTREVQEDHEVQDTQDYYAYEYPIDAPTRPGDLHPHQIQIWTQRLRRYNHL